MRFWVEETVEVDIPGENKPMRFPASLPKDQAAFGEILRSMLSFSEQNAQAEIFKRWLDDNQNHLSSHDKDYLKDSYDLIRQAESTRSQPYLGFCGTQSGASYLAFCKGQQGGCTGGESSLAGVSFYVSKPSRTNLNSSVPI